MSIDFYTPAPFPDNEAQRQAAVMTSGLLQADRALKLHEMVARAADRFHTPMAAATLIHHERQQILAAIGIPNHSSARAISFCGHAILSPETVMCVPDALQDGRFAGNPAVVDCPHIRFYAGAPLVTADGFALGTLCVIDTQTRPGLSPREEDELRAMAARIMTAAAY